MKNDLIFIDNILSKIDRWRAFLFGGIVPAYRILGPSADREYMYREGERVVLIVFDYVITADIDKVIYVSDIKKWESPYDQEPISSEKRDEIIARLTQWLKADKARYEFR